MKIPQPLRLAAGQINTCVGDIRGNSQKIIEYIERARSKDCDIICFPELATCGYPPEDLLFKNSFIRENFKQIENISKHSQKIIAVVGFVHKHKNSLYNSAAVLAAGKIIDIYHKKYLPNYGVFDEKRYFTSGESFSLYEVFSNNFAVNICEDIWIEDGVTQQQARRGAGLVLSINASPYHMGKIDLRQRILKSQARKHKVFILYTNLVGGQDELIFDGQSMFISSQGEILRVSSAFEEELCIVDIDLAALPKKRKSAKVKVISLDLEKRREKATLTVIKHKALDLTEEVFKGLVLGTRDYCLKNGFKQVVLGLSGGIDSSLVAVIATEALGKENVTGLILPSKFNSQQSQEDAVELARNLGIAYKVIPIQEIFEDYLKNLNPHFSGASWNVAEENIQARIRGNILMALSNKFGWLVLSTGNKSEMSTGYATLYGDMAGGFAVIKDLPKNQVYKLAEFFNHQQGREIIPKSVFVKPPSAELKENQKDSDTLPAYEILDPVLKYYVEDDLPLAQIIKKGFEKEVVFKVAKMIDSSEYKRRQSPPGIKITPRAFGKDRRMPITNKFYEWKEGYANGADKI